MYSLFVLTASASVLLPVAGGETILIHIWSPSALVLAMHANITLSALSNPGVHFIARRKALVNSLHVWQGARDHTSPSPPPVTLVSSTFMPGTHDSGIGLILASNRSRLLALTSTSPPTPAVVIISLTSVPWGSSGSNPSGPQHR